MTAIVYLPQSLAAIDKADASERIQAEVRQLPAEQLPLQQGLSYSSCVSADPFNVMVLNISHHATTVQVKTGIFYSGVIAGCNCADDPTPVETQPEYCELLFTIDKKTARAKVTLL